LRAAVIAAMDLWQDRLSALIANGGFITPDPDASATRILALIDGLSIQAVIDQPGAASRDILRGMVIAGVERELGIALAIAPSTV